MLEILSQNWETITAGVVALAEIIVRLTPTQKDNSVLVVIKKILGFFIPNLKKGGGKH